MSASAAVLMRRDDRWSLADVAPRAFLTDGHAGDGEKAGCGEAFEDLRG